MSTPCQSTFLKEGVFGQHGLKQTPSNLAGPGKCNFFENVDVNLRKMFLWMFFLLHIQPSSTHLCSSVNGNSSSCKMWACTNKLDLQCNQIPKFVFWSSFIITGILAYMLLKLVAGGLIIYIILSKRHWFIFSCDKKNVELFLFFSSLTCSF